MGNSLRCCLACVIPCGALDVIRIVHLNGQVEEITRTISAGEVLKANPNYVLSKPSSQGVVRKILILSPDSDLKRGNIYFLIPSSSVPAEKKKNSNSNTKTVANSKTVVSTVADVKKQCVDDKKIVVNKTTTNDLNLPAVNKEVPADCQRFVTEKIQPEKKTTRHRRRTSASRASRDWRPHLESISEDSRQFSIPSIIQ
ncbi:hypothetical protein MKX01_031735 [Papaver californicum]|nr:hypothetical protein MKX01_031735 [Papaver californicum]